MKSADRDRFSLHDCRAKRIRCEDGKLTFCFPDGIWCADYGEDWPNTGKASVSYRIDPMREVTIYLFRMEEGKTIREECTVEELIEKVNSRQWELEFAYCYYGYGEVFHSCWIWQEEEPCSLETQLFIGTKETEVFEYDPPSDKR